MTDQRLDILIFGATGFIGKYTVKEAVKLSKVRPFTWGVAGRDEKALKSVLKKFAPESPNIPIVLANVKDEESLKKMTARCKILVNCVGPYSHLGEPVVKACIETLTHQIDISTEPHYMERIQLHYNKAAKDAGVYIVSSCGLSSALIDLGVIYSRQKFVGEINGVETHFEGVTEDNSKVFPPVSYRAWETAVNEIVHAAEALKVRRRLFAEPVPAMIPPMILTCMRDMSFDTDGWSVPFPGFDRTVALRTQRYFYEKYKSRPIQVQNYLTCESLFMSCKYKLVRALFFKLVQYKLGRALLLKFPAIFSAGVVKKQEPHPDDMENLGFSLLVKASGWKDILPQITDRHFENYSRIIVTEITGKNPSCGATCTILLCAALTILNESDDLPDKGGVLTPGVAFRDTTLIQHLCRNGIEFTVVKILEVN